MKHIQLKTGKNPLFLVEQEVPKNTKQVSVPDSLNHIMIVDVSGSMSGSLKGLGEDLEREIRTLPAGDSVSFGWFSGEGQYRYVVKGVKLQVEKDYNALVETIKKELYTRGMTCFSEILADTKQVVKELASFNPNFALTFFTDGYPVVSNYQKELKAIESAISDLQGQITSTMLVGYGHYYNKELMANMAQQFGGSLVHSSDLGEFSKSLRVFLDDSRDNGTKTVVKLETDLNENSKVFSINGKQVVLYKPASDGNITFVPTKKAKDYVYTITSKPPRGSTEVELTDKSGTGKSTHESLVKASYAAALVLTQSTKTDVALEVLSTIGDVGLIKAVTNSYTNDEYGRTESAIAQAMAMPSKRFTEGRDTNFLPPENAFCLLDVMNLLMSDDEAFFHPQDENFSYNRISRGTKNKEGFSDIVFDEDAKSPLSDLVWNDKKMNLSIKAKIDGTVKLKGAKKVGLQENYRTYAWRNYSIVKDGFLNVQVLPVSLSKSTFETLKTNGVIDATEKYAKDKVYALQLWAVPVINRGIANGKTSAKALCEKAWEEIQLEGKLKALRHIKSELSSKTFKDTGALTSEQAQFLEDHGITRNGYSPKVDREESTDSYMAKEFEIKIKGFSSLPSVNDIMKKCKDKKFTGLTGAQSLVAAGFEEFWKSPVKDSNASIQLAWVNEQIKNYTDELAYVRKQIQETKFAILLGKKWFDEFTSREDNTLKVGENQFTISVREVQVNI